jgi:protoporphyrinogen oxidase
MELLELRIDRPATYTSAGIHHQMRIAVLGGGLSGLSSAFHLSRRFPTAKVSLIEKQTRLGGWVRSQRVPINENVSILLEAGPRTLRPDSKSVLELVMYFIFWN